MTWIREDIAGIDSNTRLREARFGSNRGFTQLDENGVRLFDRAIVYEDLPFKLDGVRTDNDKGKVYFDWVFNALRFAPNSDIYNPEERVQGSEPWLHSFKYTEKDVPVEIHFQWMQFNDKDVHRVHVKYRITNIGESYTKDTTDWFDIFAYTNHGQDLKPFNIGGGKDFMLQTTVMGIEPFTVSSSAEIEVMITRVDDGSESGEEFLYIKRLAFHVQKDKMGSNRTHDDEIL